MSDIGDSLQEESTENFPARDIVMAGGVTSGITA